MSKYFILMMGAVSLVGCATIERERARQEFNHEVYISVENARINDEPACILGGKIKNAIEKLKDKIK